MKKIYVVLLVFVLTSNIFPQSWSLKWHNGGDGWIDGWHIATDKYKKVRLSSTDMGVILFTASGWWACAKKFDLQFPSEWTNRWTNNGSGYFNKDGKGIFGQTMDVMFDGNTTNIIHRNINAYGVQTYFCTYDANLNDWIFLNGSFSDGWVVRSEDKYVAGNFNGDNLGKQELISFNHATGWAALHSVTVAGNNTIWSSLWGNAGSHWFNGWYISTGDVFFAANVDGGSADELVCLSEIGWCTIYKYNNNNNTWSILWTNNGSGSIDGWGIQPSLDRYTVADFNGDGTDEIFFLNSGGGWASLKKFANGNFSDIYANGGNGWINSWHISEGDNYVTFRSGPSLKGHLLCINTNGWGMIQEFSAPYNPPVEDKSVVSSLDEKSVLTVTNYPNPFNPVTKINFSIPVTQQVILEVYNELGSRVKTLVNQSLNSGEHTFEFDGSNFSSGIYYYKITTQLSGSITKRMILVK